MGSFNRLAVVLPTYNERKNIGILIPLIKKTVKSAIIVVDDDSPDGTAHAVRELQKTFDNIFLLERKKKGLGRAILQGIDFASTMADHIITMDADLSHPVSSLPVFAKLCRKHDLVVGSRYVKGGGTVGWSLHRKMMSRLGNLYVRFGVGLAVNDATSGFRAFSSHLFSKVDRNKLYACGYAFQVSLLYQLHQHAKSPIEVPFIFSERMHGKTKLSLFDVLEFAYVVPRIKNKNSNYSKLWNIFKS